jgi:hypothetical protein
MQIEIPPKVRVALYVITALGTPIVATLTSQHILADWVVSLWSGEVTAVTAMAALRVAK